MAWYEFQSELDALFGAGLAPASGSAAPSEEEDIATFLKANKGLSKLTDIADVVRKADPNSEELRAAILAVPFATGDEAEAPILALESRTDLTPYEKLEVLGKLGVGFDRTGTTVAIQFFSDAWTFVANDPQVSAYVLRLVGAVAPLGQFLRGPQSTKIDVSDLLPITGPGNDDWSEQRPLVEKALRWCSYAAVYDGVAYQLRRLGLFYDWAYAIIEMGDLELFKLLFAHYYRASQAPPGLDRRGTRPVDYLKVVKYVAAVADDPLPFLRVIHDRSFVFGSLGASSTKNFVFKVLLERKKFDAAEAEAGRTGVLADADVLPFLATLADPEPLKEAWRLEANRLHVYDAMLAAAGVGAHENLDFLLSYPENRVPVYERRGRLYFEAKSNGHDKAAGVVVERLGVTGYEEIGGLALSERYPTDFPPEE